MPYEHLPDGFIRKAGVRRSYAPPPPPPPPRHRGSFPSGLVVIAVLVALALVAIIATNLGERSTGNSNPPPQLSPVIDTGWPIDRPDLIPTAYVQSISARVQGLKFFEAGDVAPAQNERMYGTSFRPAEGQFIYWELNLVHPTRQIRQSYTIALYLYNPNGSTKSQTQSESYVEPGWMSSYHFNKWMEPANAWTPGDYRVSLFVDGIKIAAGVFTLEARQDDTQIAAD